jgi:signal transduction histidine kinase
LYFFYFGYTFSLPDAFSISFFWFFIFLLLFILFIYFFLFYFFFLFFVFFIFFFILFLFFLRGGACPMFIYLIYYSLYFYFFLVCFCPDQVSSNNTVRSNIAQAVQLSYPSISVNTNQKINWRIKPLNFLSQSDSLQNSIKTEDNHEEKTQISQRDNFDHQPYHNFFFSSVTTITIITNNIIIN